MKQKLFTLLTLLLCAVTSSWAEDVELVNIDFTSSSWSGKTFSQGNDSNVDLINGVYFWSKSSSKHFSLSNNTTDGLTFPDNNISSGNYYLCIPLTGINGKITVTLKHAYNSSKASYKYVYIDGRDSFENGNTNGSGGTEAKDNNNADTEISFTLNAAKTVGHLIIGRSSSSFKNIKGIIVTTPGISKVATPSFDPVSGMTFTSSLSVDIACSTPSSTIYYTTDGSTPSKTNGTAYTGAISLTSTTTLKAIAYDDTETLSESNVATAKYTKVKPSADRSWNFTSWSAATKTGVLGDGTNWSVNEKKDNDESALTDKVQTNKTEKSGTELVYGSTKISETEGLNFNIAEYSLGIAYNQGSTDLGTYEGSQYLWLYSSWAKIIIPNVLAGSTITIGVESHKTSDERTLTVTNTTEGSVKATTYQVATFTATATGNVQISPSKGMHIYFINIMKNADVIPVQSYGWATYITDKDVEFEDGDAVVVTDVNAETGVITTAAVSQAPANTPVLLKTAGEKDVTPIAVTPSAPATNLLSVSDGAANGTKVPYVLAKNGEGAGFMKWTGDIAKLEGRVVLWLDSEIAAARDFFDLDGGTTGIKAVENQKVAMDNKFYNLAGQQVAAPTKGLYIVNGKKVIIK